MPSERILKEKQELVAKLCEEIKSAASCVLVDYKGINVEEDTKLRKDLREAGVNYRVIKNSLLTRAMEDAGYAPLKDALIGTTAMALSTEDVVAPAKILVKHAEASKGKFTVKAGFVEGNVVDADELTALSKLPSREELVAMVLRGFNAPLSGFANVLNGNLRGLAIALGQIAEQAEKSA